MTNKPLKVYKFKEKWDRQVLEVFKDLVLMDKVREQVLQWEWEVKEICRD